MSTWFDCVCCSTNQNRPIVKLKQKQSRREIKQSLLGRKNLESKRKWSKDTSIIIIGAGVSGIHMASLLHESGYTNVKILERTRKIGGRLLSLKDKALNTVHELGTCYIYKHYTELINLRQRFDANNELIQINPNTECCIINGDSYQNHISVPCNDFIQTHSHLSTPMDASDIKMIYKKLYENIFGTDYANNNEMHIPPKPDSENMNLINMSTLDFLCQNGLKSLCPHFVYRLSFHGYGKLNEIPAFYGLWYNKPNTLFGNDSSMYVLKHGMHSLFDKIVQKSNINIVHNVNLKSIDRHIKSKNKATEIKYVQNIDEAKEDTIECEILFIACDMTAIRTANEEKEIFDDMNTFSLCCTLCECDIDRDSKAVTYWPQMLLNGDSHLFSLRNSSKLILKEKYNKLCAENKLKKEKFVSCQFSDKPRRNGSGVVFKQILLKDLKDLKKRNVKILKQRVLRFFPKFNQNGINKYYPWKIQSELQGKHKNTFYIGKSTCFDDIESELQYNIQLKQMLHL